MALSASSQGGRPPSPLVIWIKRDPFFHGSYYISLTAYGGAMLLFAFLAIYVFPRVNRGKVYRRGHVRHLAGVPVSGIITSILLFVVHIDRGRPDIL